MFKSTQKTKKAVKAKNAESDMQLIHIGRLPKAIKDKLRKKATLENRKLADYMRQVLTREALAN